MKILAVIPARKNSKSVKFKNRTLLFGKPLIEYTFVTVKKSKTINRVIVSTDDPKICKLAQSFRVEAPFLRPRKLASDTTPMIRVLQHALNFLKRKSSYIPDVLILLQPTSPLRTEKHIDAAIRLFLRKKADSLVSLVQAPHQFSPNSLMRMTRQGFVTPFTKDKLILRRQEKPLLFARNGPAILIVRSALVARGNLYGGKCVGYLMRPEESVDIDSQLDLLLAELLLKKKRLG